MSQAPGSVACRAIAVAAVLLLIIVAAIAVPRGRNAATPAANPAAASIAGGASAVGNAAPQVFRYFTEQPRSLDPALASDAYSALVIAQMFSPLMGLTSDLEPTPQMAESWTISRDGLTYVFRIRQGVQFHSGRLVTAHDFVYSLTRLFQEPFRSQGLAAGYLEAIVGAPEYLRGEAQEIRGIRALDDHTLEIRLSRPYGALLSALALDQTSVVPRENVEATDLPFAANPVGCGPFQLAYRRGTEQIVLAANRRYFLGKPAIDSIVFETPQGSVDSLGAHALMQGQAAMATLPVSLLGELQKRSDLRIVRWQDLSLSFIGMNATIPPLDKPQVRQAVSLAMDRQGMLNLWPNGKVISTGILPPGLPGFSAQNKTYDHNVATAKRLLASAGYGASNPLPSIPIYKSAGTPATRSVDTLMVKSLAEAGIRLEIRYAPWSELDSLITGRHAPMFGLAWVADIPDPDTFLRSLFYSKSNTNYFQFSDPVIDSLLDLAQRTADPAERVAAYQQVERTVVQSAPIVPLFHSSTFVGLRDDVSGLAVNPLGISTLAMEKLQLGSPSAGVDPRQATR